MNAAHGSLVFCIRLYRWFISPAKVFLFGPMGRCRFTPSCSEYAIEAIKTHGAFKGGWLALKRLVRCHPWGGCGEDPVPLRESKIENQRNTPKRGHRTALVGVHALACSTDRDQKERVEISCC
jgi:putative membrane protein insertion efficiency factor